MSFSRKYIAKRLRQKKRSTRKRRTIKRKSMMKQKGGGGQGLGLTYYGEKEYESEDNIEKIIYKNLLFNIQNIFEIINDFSKIISEKSKKNIDYNNLFNPAININVPIDVYKTKLNNKTIYPKLKSIKEETYNNKLRYRLEFNKLDETDFEKFIYVKFGFLEHHHKHEFNPTDNYKIFTPLPIASGPFVVYIKPKTNLFFKDNNNFSLTKIDESGNETEVSNVFLNNLYYIGNKKIDMNVFNTKNHNNIKFEKFESPKTAIQLENEEEPLGFGDAEEPTTTSADVEETLGFEEDEPLGFEEEGGRKRTRRKKHRKLTRKRRQ